MKPSKNLSRRYIIKQHEGSWVIWDKVALGPVGVKADHWIKCWQAYQDMDLPQERPYIDKAAISRQYAKSYLKRKLEEDPEFNSKKWLRKKDMFLKRKKLESDRLKLLRLEAYKNSERTRIPSDYVKVERKATCQHCGKEFTGNAKAKWCRPSHSASARETRRLRKRMAKGKHKPRPAWQDTKSLNWFYRNCPPGMVVDHIIPLNHPEVSGMHCVMNLQYLSVEDNTRKSNKFDGTNDNEKWMVIT